jgi:hypothetical protein
VKMECEWRSGLTKALQLGVVEGRACKCEGLGRPQAGIQVAKISTEKRGLVPNRELMRVYLKVFC